MIWEEGSVEIFVKNKVTGAPTKRERKGIVSGPFGIYFDNSEAYCLSHLPSGRAIHEFETEGKAKKGAAALVKATPSGLDPWLEEDPRTVIDELLIARKAVLGGKLGLSSIGYDKKGGKK